jgi:hypothetical protein
MTDAESGSSYTQRPTPRRTTRARPEIRSRPLARHRRVSGVDYSPGQRGASMGCDVDWSGRLPDIATQRRCAHLLTSLWREVGWPIDVFDGVYPGYWYDTELHTIASAEPRHLCGVSGRYYPEETLRRMSFVGQSRISFVFDNTPSLPEEKRHRLITVCPIDSFDREDFRGYRYAFEETPCDPASARYALIRDGAYDRLLGHARTLLTLIGVVKLYYCPELRVSDDYGIFASVENSLAQAFGATSRTRTSPEDAGDFLTELKDRLARMRVGGDEFEREASRFDSLSESEKLSEIRDYYSNQGERD